MLDCACHCCHPDQGRRRADRRDRRCRPALCRRGARRRRPLDAIARARSPPRTARGSSRTAARARATRCAWRSTRRPATSSSSSTPTDRTSRTTSRRWSAPIRAGQADLVIGSRGKGGSDELHGTLEQLIRYVGSQIIMLGINYRWNVRLTDSQNGFRAIRRDVGRRLGLTSQPDDDRAGNADEGAEAGLSRQRDCRATNTSANGAPRRSSSGSSGSPTSGRSSEISSNPWH